MDELTEKIMPAAFCASGSGSVSPARWDLEGMRMRVDHVLDLDPVLASRDLNSRPATVFGRWHIPRDRMLEKVTAL